MPRWRCAWAFVWWLADHCRLVAWFQRQPTAHAASACRSWTGRLLPLGIHKPTDTVLRWVSVDKRAILVWHEATMTKQQHQLQLPTGTVIPLPDTRDQTLRVYSHAAWCRRSQQSNSNWHSLCDYRQPIGFRSRTTKNPVSSVATFATGLYVWTQMLELQWTQQQKRPHC